jgi:double-stranded uracil-DNA glycosylase
MADGMITFMKPDNLARSFPPIAAHDARILILGSMPGVASLTANQYYAHPRNAFWPIMAALFSFDATMGYAERVRALQGVNVAVWDVLKFCERPGSLDAAILRESEVANDFADFFSRHSNITHVFFNGSTAAACFKRHCSALLACDQWRFQRLPSTSPAHAGLGFEAKLSEWRKALIVSGALPPLRKR